MAGGLRSPGNPVRDDGQRLKCHFTSADPLWFAHASMTRHFRHFIPVVIALPLLLTGCATSSITNLTPAQEPRNANGLYPVEAVWQSSQQSVVTDSIKPYVVVGLEAYPMRPTPLLKNRWETLVPIPADKDHIYYQFKFDYEYKGMPARRPDSVLSPEQRLDIVQ